MKSAPTTDFLTINACKHVSKAHALHHQVITLRKVWHKSKTERAAEQQHRNPATRKQSCELHQKVFQQEIN
jgi:hypothetical protein